MSFKCRTVSLVGEILSTFSSLLTSEPPSRPTVQEVCTAWACRRPLSPAASQTPWRTGPVCPGKPRRTLTDTQKRACQVKHTALITNSQQSARSWHHTFLDVRGQSDLLVQPPVLFAQQVEPPEHPLFGGLCMFAAAGGGALWRGGAWGRMLQHQQVCSHKTRHQWHSPKVRLHAERMLHNYVSLFESQHGNTVQGIQYVGIFKVNVKPFKTFLRPSSLLQVLQLLHLHIRAIVGKTKKWSQGRRVIFWEKK